jgi:hypothetical protein
MIRHFYELLTRQLQEHSLSTLHLERPYFSYVRTLLTHCALPTMGGENGDNVLPSSQQTSQTRDINAWVRWALSYCRLLFTEHHLAIDSFRANECPRRAFV